MQLHKTNKLKIERRLPLFIKQNRFITGFSGLRTLAVLGVILYHFNPYVFYGGYLGVPIFLVLSGYLVCDHILHDLESVGWYDLGNFYLKRIKKLYPQLICVLMASGTYMLLFQQNLLAKFNQVFWANMTWTYNFWQIANGQSYFDRFAGNESPFVHLWTMALEGQFYLVFPILAICLFALTKKRSTIFWLTAILTLLSMLEMALLFRAGQDTSRIYYGTDTRFYSLGLGVMLACVWPSSRLSESISAKAMLSLDFLGLASLVAMLLMMCSSAMDGQLAFAYQGGMQLFSVLVTLFVAVVAHPGSHWNQLMTNSLFNWCGSRSYGIYLYQYPVMIFFEDKFTDWADNALWYHFWELCIIILLAEVSYRFVERPLGKVDISQVKSFLASLFAAQKATVVKSVLALFILAGGSFAIIKSPTINGSNANSSQLAARIEQNAKNEKATQKQAAAKIRSSQAKKTTSTTATAKILAQAKAAGKSHPVNRGFEKYGISQTELQLAQKVSVTAVGDSVMAGSSNDLQQLMPNALINAAVSRQLIDSMSIFTTYASQGELAQNVVVGLGTNGPFSQADVAKLMSVATSSRHVFWINVHVPTRSWQNQVNATLKAAAKKYKNLTVIDWYDYSKTHSQWFYDDRTHPNIKGSKYYSSFVVKQIVKHAKY